MLKYYKSNLEIATETTYCHTETSWTVNPIFQGKPTLKKIPHILTKLFSIKRGEFLDYLTND